MDWKIEIIGAHGKLYAEAGAVETRLKAELESLVKRLARVEGANVLRATLYGSAFDHTVGTAPTESIPEPAPPPATS